jgi:uncharacterized membrane protein YphA (DoxX/SURF4 family)
MRAARLAVAAVWCYEGLWCKVLRPDAGQRSIVAAVPGLPVAWAPAALAGIGVLETAIGGWVLSGAQPRRAAWAQTGLLVAVNAGGLLFARSRIPAPGRMLTQNAVLLTLAWLLAEQPAHRPADG